MSILILVAAILLLLFLTLNKVSPFIALLLITIAAGLAVGLAAIFKASIGKTMLYGLLVAIPVVLLAGILFGKRFRNSAIMAKASIAKDIGEDLPSAALSIFIALLPVLLIAVPAALLSFI